MSMAGNPARLTSVHPEPASPATRESPVGCIKSPPPILSPPPLTEGKTGWEGGGGSMYLYRVAHFAESAKYG